MMASDPEGNHIALGTFPGAISFSFRERALMSLGSKGYMIDVTHRPAGDVLSLSKGLGRKDA